MRLILSFVSESSVRFLCSSLSSLSQLIDLLSVDYIRTYTWDKRIESWVKETTFLGSSSFVPSFPLSY